MGRAVGPVRRGPLGLARLFAAGTALDGAAGPGTDTAAAAGLFAAEAFVAGAARFAAPRRGASAPSVVVRA